MPELAYAAAEAFDEEEEHARNWRCPVCGENCCDYQEDEDTGDEDDLA